MAQGPNIYGELIRAQLENLSSDPTFGVAGRALWQTVDARAKIDTGTEVKSLAWFTDIANTSYDLTNLSLTATVAANALTVAVKTQTGANPSATSPVTAGFRSATVTSGVYSLVTITSALSVVVPSTATLGHSNGNLRRIYVYLINNAGTAELAVSSGIYRDNSIVSTTGTPANSNYVMYSTTGRSNVACRLIGYIESTQATAGTWVTAPSKIQLVPFTPIKTVARYIKNAQQNILNNTTTDVTWTTKQTDNCDIQTSNTFVSNRTGFARVHAYMSFGGSTVDIPNIDCTLVKNGSALETLGVIVAYPGVAYGPVGQFIFVDENCAVGDVYKIQVLQNSGVTIPLTDEGTNPGRSTRVFIEIDSSEV